MAWGDDAHVDENRRLYAEKFDLAETVFADAYDFQRPAAGFFLWLNVGHGEAAALHLWREQGVRVLPGAYLAADEHAAHAAPYIRIALAANAVSTPSASKSPSAPPGIGASGSTWRPPKASASAISSGAIMAARKRQLG